MIFNIGESKKEKAARLGHWHKVFLWKPTYLGNGITGWLMFVERILVGHTHNKEKDTLNCYEWNYRLLKHYEPIFKKPSFDMTKLMSSSLYSKIKSKL